MTENAHKGHTGDLTADAMGVAGAVFAKLGMPSREMFDWQDEEQEWKLHVLTHLHTYDPSKGTITTWVYWAWKSWWHRSVQNRTRRTAFETGFDSTPGAYDGGEEMGLAKAIEGITPPAPGSHEVSDRALELIGLLPKRIHETMTTHLAFGASAESAGAVHGRSARTITRHAREARDIWSEHFGVEIAVAQFERHTETHCNKGHLWASDNLRFTSVGMRYCKACLTIKGRRKGEARRAEVEAMMAA